MSSGHSNGWIGFDFDGTLAHYDTFEGAGVLGAPILPSVAIVKKLRAKGIEVRIVTARVWCPPEVPDVAAATRVESAVDVARLAIESWCLAHIGEVLPITCEKDYSMWCLFDDRAVTLEKNTGRIAAHPTVLYELLGDAAYDCLQRP